MNIVICKGHTTRDVEIRYLQNGTAIGSFGIAVNRKWKSEAGEMKEEVSFFDVDAWGKTAETIAQYFGKGSPILITGRLKQETWDDKQTGQKRSKVKIVLSQFDFCGDTKGSGAGVQSAPPGDQDGASARYGGQPHSTAANSAPVAGDGPREPEDDNIPF